MGRGTPGPGSGSFSSLAPPCGSDLPLQLATGILTASFVFSLTGPAESVCGTSQPIDIEIKDGRTSEISVPLEVWIAAEIALKKAYLKPEPLPQGQMPKPGFGMDPFPGQLRLARTALRLRFKMQCFGGKCGEVTEKIRLKFRLRLGTETSTLSLEGPGSVPATGLLTVALRSLLEQIKKEFTSHF